MGLRRTEFGIEGCGGAFWCLGVPEHLFFVRCTFICTLCITTYRLFNAVVNISDIATAKGVYCCCFSTFSSTYNSLLSVMSLELTSLVTPGFAKRLYHM